MMMTRCCCCCCCCCRRCCSWNRLLLWLILLLLLLLRCRKILRRRKKCLWFGWSCRGCHVCFVWSDTCGGREKRRGCKNNIRRRRRRRRRIRQRGCKETTPAAAAAAAGGTILMTNINTPALILFCLIVVVIIVVIVVKLGQTESRHCNWCYTLVIITPYDLLSGIAGVDFLFLRMQCEMRCSGGGTDTLPPKRLAVRRDDVIIVFRILTGRCATKTDSARRRYPATHTS